jgi:O-antigen/teichoic acid export membrane protein
MAGEVKSLVKHGAVYTVGTVLRQLVSFLLIPLYTNYLTPAEYGILELMGLTVDIVAIFVAVAMTMAVMRFYHKYDTTEAQNRAVSSALIGTVTLMAVATAICFALSSQISSLVFDSTEYTFYFQLMFGSMFFTSGIEIPMVFYRARLRSLAVVILSLVKLVIQLSLNIYFLVVLDKGVEGVLYSGVISAALISAYMVVTTFREVGIHFSWPQYKEMLLFGAPLLVADLSIFALTYADRYFLNHYSDLTSVGLYSIASKFAIVVSLLFSSPFRAIWGVQMYEFAKQDNRAELFGRVATYFLMGALAISLALSVFTKDVLRVMSEESFWSAYHLVPVLCITFVLKGLIAITGAGILIKSKTKYKAISTAVAMIVALLLNYLMIPRWGGYGAAAAGLFAAAVRLGIDAFYSQRLLRVDYQWAKIFQVSGIYVLAVIASHYIDIENIYYSIAADVGIMLAFAAAVYFSPFLSEDDRKMITSIIRKPSEAVRIMRG